METGNHTEWEELYACAHHEAGHAVMAYWFRQPFLSVDVVGSENAAGSVKMHSYSSKTKSLLLNKKGEFIRGRRAIEREVMVLMAGNAAESLFTGEIPTEPIWDAAFNPDSDVFKAVNDLGLLRVNLSGLRAEEYAYAEWLWWRTRAILSIPDLWAAVEALADQLMITPLIRSRRARKIIKDALQQRHGGEPYDLRNFGIPDNYQIPGVRTA